MPKTHGMYRARIYKIYHAMISRCENQNNTKYHHYGGRGIKVCSEWRDDFMAFYAWAMIHGYKDDLTIDRLDYDKDYCPDNCKWATVKEQNSHLRPRKDGYMLNYNGMTMNAKQWSKHLGIPYTTVIHRLNRGWSTRDALRVG